jgi:hypothetical protein
MSTKTVRQYSAFVGAKPQQDVTGYPWPHLQPMGAVCLADGCERPNCARPTVPAPGPSSGDKRAQAVRYREEASRLLARAADLDASADADDGLV